MKKIVLTGPESSGKTYLSKQLSAYYKCSCTEEYAREYLQSLNRPYNFEDIIKIAEGQSAYEDYFLNSSTDLLICDSDILVCKIWQEYRFGYSADWINETFENRHYDLFLLCSPDIAWEEDPLRENQFDRDLIFDLYHKYLSDSNKTFVLVKGNFEERFNLAVESVNKVI